MSRRRYIPRRTPRMNQLIDDLPAGLARDWQTFEDLVNPPRDLKEFYGVARRLAVVVRQLPTDVREDITRQLWASSRAATEVAHRASTADLRFWGNRSQSKGDHVHPFYGYLARHPVYCLLGFPDAGRLAGKLDNDADRGLARMQAHLLVLTAVLGKEYHSALSKCCRGLREAQGFPERHGFLRNAAQWDNLLATFERRLKEQINRGSYRACYEAQDGFRLLFDYLGGKVLRRPSGHRRHTGSRRPAERVELDNDPDTTEPSETAVRALRADRSSRIQAQRLGAAPGDVANQYVTSRSRGPVRHKRGETPAQAVRATRRQRRALAMRNQRLPLDTERLQAPALHALFDDLGTLFHPDRDQTGGRNHQLRLLAELVFWTGSTAEEVLNAHIAPETSQLPNPTDRHLVPDRGWWLVPAPVLDYPARAQPDWASSMRPTAGFIALPLPSCVRDLVQPLLPPRVTGRRLLFRDTAAHEKLQEALSQRLQDLNRSHRGVRLTLLRLALHRLYRLLDKTGDLAEAALITGRTRSVELDSPLYYHAPWLGELAQRYVDSCQRDHACLGPEADRIQSSGNNVQVPDGVTAGVEVCPRREVVSELVYGLVARVDSARANIHFDLDSLCRWHNRLTGYVTALAMWATGHRVVEGPICDRDHLIGEYLWVDDKRSTDRGQPRPLWLPAIVREQLDAYDRHAAEVLGRLMGLRPRSLHDRAAAPVDKKADLPYLFRLRPNQRRPDGVEIKAITPRRYGALLRPVVRWPVNVHRHFLRTQLREAGVGGEVVDAFMGHGLIGSEALSSHSSLAPAAIAAETGPVIESLLEEAGWPVLYGLGTP